MAEKKLDRETRIVPTAGPSRSEMQRWYTQEQLPRDRGRIFVSIDRGPGQALRTERSGCPLCEAGIPVRTESGR